MVQQTIDSKFTEYGLGNTETNFSTHDKQIPICVKKIALREVQNENRIPNSVGNSPLSKDGGQTINAIKILGSKRPSSECQMNPPVPRKASPMNGAPNSHLVYVRRKPEAETGKLGHLEEPSQPKPQIKEQAVSCFRALAPMPATAPTSASGKPSVSRHLGQSNNRFTSAEFNHHPVASAVPSPNPNEVKSMNWEEQYHQLQILLKKLDESEQQEYVQMLRSISCIDLSRHAIELEKRSIQLSLEEAKEVHRVGVLNVLAKSLKNFKAPSTHQSQSEK